MYCAPAISLGKDNERDQVDYVCLAIPSYSIQYFVFWRESMWCNNCNILSSFQDCLLLKATSQSAMDCLEQCLGMLQRQDNAQGHRSQPNVDLSQSMANITYVIIMFVFNLL